MLTVVRKKSVIPAIILLSVHLTMGQWLQSSSELNVTSFALFDSFPLAGTQDQGIYISADDSSGWESADSGLPVDPYYPSSYRTVNAMTVGKSNIFAAVHGEGVFHISDDGDMWVPGNDGLPADQWGSIFVYTLAVRGTDLFAGTGDGGVYRSTDGGTSWAPADAGLPATPNSHVWSFAVNGLYLFACTDSGVYRTSGNNWMEADSGLPKKSYRYIRSLVSSGTYVFAGGGGGDAYGVFRSDDNGNIWTAASTGLPSNVVITSLASSGNIIFAGTEYDGVFITGNNGNSWTAFNSGLPGAASLIGVSALVVNKSNLYAGMIFYVQNEKTGKLDEFHSLWRLPLKSIAAAESRRNIRIKTCPDLSVSCRFDRTVTVAFNLSEPQNVILDIFDFSGKKTAELENTMLGTGTHNYQYRANRLSSGCYLVRLKAGAAVKTRRLQLP
jgi:hypothetical protein